MIPLQSPKFKFKSPEGSLNSTYPKIKCTKNWNCKRMQCETCAYKRKQFFVNCGLICTKQWGLDTFVTISWRWQNPANNSWCVATSNMSKLSKKMTCKRIRPYIRVLAVGNKNCPHVHLSLSKLNAQKLLLMCPKLWGKKVNIDSKPITDAAELLGYFFDQNFLISYKDHRRVKGIRLLSASRPMPCGYPSFKAFSMADKFAQNTNLNFPLESTAFKDFFKMLKLKRRKNV